ncbi:hypothetical protein [Microbacterium sp. KRD172]|uniref:hypothetical protein n=1 Tax=Microbacterium sp. KRD172 TaxID=2729727 RepID=UPI0019D2638E|nr:hypothetical protein [Microbacterium sp. KRD172]
MRILLLAPSGAFAEALAALALGEDNRQDQTVVVFATSTDASGATQEIRLGPKAAPSSGQLARALNSSVIGRNAKRLSPLDGGHRFARVASRSMAFRSAAETSDVIIGLERDSILAAWTALNRWASPYSRAVYGLAPGAAVLASMRSASN